MAESAKKKPPQADDDSSSSEEEYDFSNDPDEFACTLCPSSFVTRASLARHMILHEHQDEKMHEHSGETVDMLKNGDSASNSINGEAQDVVEYEDYEEEEEEDDDDTDMMVPVIDIEEPMADLPPISQAGADYDYEDGDEDEENMMMMMMEEDQDPGQDDQEGLEGEEEDGDFDPIVKINASLNGIRVERKHQCDECGVSFLSKINLVRHMATHSVNRPHKCPMCGKGFVRKEHLTKHLSSVHSGMKFTCNFCGKDISRKDHLIRHIRNVHPAEYLGFPNELPANVPPELYTSTLDKAIQSLQPKPKKPYLTCDMCEARFTNLTMLHEHQSTVHADVRRFKCEYCPKAFKRKEHLTKHIVLHTGEKAFPCLNCGKEFPRKDALQDHIRRIHGTSDIMTMEYPCNFCDKVFLQRPNLLRHMKNHHGLVVSIPADYQDISGNNSTSNDAINSSLFSYDGQVSFTEELKSLMSSISCAHCTATFSNQADFKHHVRTQHAAS